MVLKISFRSVQSTFSKRFTFTGTKYMPLSLLFVIKKAQTKIKIAGLLQMIFYPLSPFTWMFECKHTFEL